MEVSPAISRSSSPTSISVCAMSITSTETLTSERQSKPQTGSTKSDKKISSDENIKKIRDKKCDEETLWKQQQAELRWKSFTDEEYADWKTFKDCDYKVPVRSVFSYVKVEPYKIDLNDEPPKKPVMKVLTEMVKNNLGAYARIQIGEHTFQCIPRLLKCYSVWFANRDWRLNSFKFDEKDVPARGFAAVYEWMRTQKLPDFGLTVTTLQAARYLKVDLLENECWTLLSSDAIYEKRSFLIYLEAKRSPKLKEVSEAMLGRLRNYFLALVGSPEFLCLKVDTVDVILRQDSIGVNSEMEVFFAVLRWLGHGDMTKRLLHMRRLMKCVRFQLLPMTFLFSLRESLNRKDKEVLFRTEPALLAFNSDPETMIVLERAISFIGVRCQHPEDFLTVAGDHGIEIVFPRHWVYHAKCPYHLRELDFPYQHRFTASDFGDYIASIQKDWVGDGPPNHGRNLIFDVDSDQLIRKGFKKATK
ncbi:uncharacterized protein LOC108105804 [Drosophila eugracilis]|uniref:uncharacterized protein LOC108105804 n=1 Tax=Drosophila eugracilis TaxID=29029 RepID=UPI001BDA965A|nr:uncharacterized protein LOC108105804 [Drosophila eugracilis]